MDVEQRIGRIHRYGQRDTAQVYNLVLSDTIEGRIYILLNDKLQEIAKTLGKVDEQGNVTEDLRSQILGQLSEKLSYDQLYRDALSDPELKRTKEELEAAMTNADEARKAVFTLFQDLDGFSLNDYRPYEDLQEGQTRLVMFTDHALKERGDRLRRLEGERMVISFSNGDPEIECTVNRDLAQDEDNLDLLGIDHPLVTELLNNWKMLPPESIGVSIVGDNEGACVITIWLVHAHPKGAEKKTYLVPLAVDSRDQRCPDLEKKLDEVFRSTPKTPVLKLDERRLLLDKTIDPMLHRELQYRGIATQQGGYTVELVGWIETA